MEDRKLLVEEALIALNARYVRPGEHEHAGEWYFQLDCSRCGLTDHYRLGINWQRLTAYCWACGPLPVWQALHETTGRDYKTVRDAFAGIAPAFNDQRSYGRAAGTLVIPDGVGPLLGPHRAFLEARGLDPDKTAAEWNLWGIGQAGGRLAWRIWIPVTLKGKTVSWTTRTVGNDKTRYWSAKPEQERFPHKTLLYGEDKVKGHTILCVEGPSDVWAVGPGAVATFGTAYTPSQVARLASYPVRLVCFDSGEDAARKKAEALVETLSSHPGRTAMVTLTSGKDASRVNSAELAELRALAGA